MAARDRTSVQSPAPGVGTPPLNENRLSDILHVEVGKLQNDGEHIKNLLGEVRTDIKDIRDRLARLEERVSHLPSKGFIALVITTGLAIAVGLGTVVSGLQSYLFSPKQQLSSPLIPPPPAPPKSP